MANGYAGVATYRIIIKINSFILYPIVNIYIEREIFALVFTVTEFGSYGIFLFMQNIILLVKQGRSLEGGGESCGRPRRQNPRGSKVGSKMSTLTGKDLFSALKIC